MPSTGFFTNYTVCLLALASGYALTDSHTIYQWPAHYPSVTTKFFDSLPPKIQHLSPKTLQDVYTGIDVWGRGSHGGGGLGCYRALEHINPNPSPSEVSSDPAISARGSLSVALFGQAWTWESEQDKPDWDWDQWWSFERRLWLGPEDENEKVEVPDAPVRREGELVCPHGPFRPVASFFESKSPPDPADLPFFTSFCPGVGRGWWVNGSNVWRTELEGKDKLTGWTDVSKQGSIGDLLWPRPNAKWEDVGREESAPQGRCSFVFEDAWQGGNSLRVAFDVQGSDAEDAFFRSMWLPVQSFALTPGKSYDAYIIFKSESENLDMSLSLKVPRADASTDEDAPVSTSEELTNCWTRLSFSFTPTSDSAHIGLVVGFAAEDPSEALYLSFLLGQLCLYPSSPPPPTLTSIPRILWADFQRSTTPPDPFSLPDSTSGTNATSNVTIPPTGALTWEVSATFPPLPLTTTIPSPEDPNPIWNLDVSEHWFPSFLYFNIYVQAHDAEGKVKGPEAAKFVGTTGYDGRRGRFWVDGDIVGGVIGNSGASGGRLRFYVQGITEKGEVLTWDRCCYVDT